MTHNEIAEYAFDVLADVAADGTTITYGELAERIETFVLTLFPALGVLWGWCDERGYPHLNALVVNEKTGMPGDGYKPGGRPLGEKDWRETVAEVHQFDWSDVTPPDLS